MAAFHAAAAWASASGALRAAVEKAAAAFLKSFSS
jgi:hypothetical protein